MAAQLKVGDLLKPVTRDVREEKMVEFEKCVWDRGRNSHSDINAAKADGISRTIASGQNQMAFLHELLERNFGDGSVKPHFASGPLIGIDGGPIPPLPPNEALQSHDRGSFVPGSGR